MNFFNKDICCRELWKILNNREMETWYNPTTRGFGLYDRLIKNCPMCGKEFPVELADFYGEIQEKEFGITRANYSDHEKLGLIPKEFDSDEWWLKREHYANFPTKHLTRAEWLKSIPFDSSSLSDQQQKVWYKKILKKEKKLEQQLGVFCCTSFWERVFDTLKDLENPTPDSHSMILFEPEKRRFLLKSMPYVEEKVFHKRRPKRLLLSQCFYCPWCGKELPKNLAPLWFKIVTTEFGVTDIFNQKQLTRKLPPEFLTEQWWRQRGL